MQAGAITEASIRVMVDRFYARVREDAVLSPVFDRQLSGQWEAHLPRMYAFWTKLLLGTGDFQANVFGKHMAIAGIEREHFVRWLGLFRQTVDEVYEPDDAGLIMQAAERIARSLQLGYFGREVV